MTTVRTYLELMNADIPEVEYLVQDIIPRSGLVYCYGPPGSFKTNFMLYASILGADGQDILGFKVRKPFKTLWIDEENRDPGMKDKIRKIYGAIIEGINGIRDPQSITKNLVTSDMDFRLTSVQSILQLDLFLNTHRPDLVVIDSVAKVFPLDERNEQEVKKIYTILSPLIIRYGVTFLLIHHCRKRAKDQGYRDMEDIAGSREFGAQSDSMFMIEEKKHGSYNLKQTKHRYGEKCRTISFDVLSDKGYITVISKGAVAVAIKKTNVKIADEIRAWYSSIPKETFTYKEVVEVMKDSFNHKETSIKQAIKYLFDEDFILRTTRGTYTVKKVEEKVTDNNDEEIDENDDAEN